MWFYWPPSPKGSFGPKNLRRLFGCLHSYPRCLIIHKRTIIIYGRDRRFNEIRRCKVVLPHIWHILISFTTIRILWFPYPHQNSVIPLPPIRILWFPYPPIRHAHSNIAIYMWTWLTNSHRNDQITKCLITLIFAFINYHWHMYYI